MNCAKVVYEYTCTKRVRGAYMFDLDLYLYHSHNRAGSMNKAHGVAYLFLRDNPG